MHKSVLWDAQCSETCTKIISEYSYILAVLFFIKKRGKKIWFFYILSETYDKNSKNFWQNVYRWHFLSLETNMKTFVLRKIIWMEKLFLHKSQNIADLLEQKIWLCHFSGEAVGGGICISLNRRNPVIIHTNSLWIGLT